MAVGPTQKHSAASAGRPAFSRGTATCQRQRCCIWQAHAPRAYEASRSFTRAPSLPGRSRALRTGLRLARWARRRRFGFARRVGGRRPNGHTGTRHEQQPAAPSSRRHMAGSAAADGWYGCSRARCWRRSDRRRLRWRSTVGCCWKETRPPAARKSFAVRARRQRDMARACLPGCRSPPTASRPAARDLEHCSKTKKRALGRLSTQEAEPELPEGVGDRPPQEQMRRRARPAAVTRAEDKIGGRRDGERVDGVA